MAVETNGNTILLSKDEVKSIRDGIQAWQDCRRAPAGTKAQPRDPAVAIREATGASLMLDMGGAVDPDLVGKSSGQIPRPLLVFDQPYSPSLSDVQNLEEMRFADLRLETHHRGFYLKVRRVSPVLSFALRSWIVVEDEGGEVERLDVYLHTKMDDIEILESASEFYIKEPYFAVNRHGQAVIHVDHPSDLVAINQAEAREDESRSDSPFERASSTVDRVLMLKDAGNAAFKRQELLAALALYSKALQISSNFPPVSYHLVNAVLRNRAHLNLLTGRFEQAKADALASLTTHAEESDKLLNAKAYFRAGCAAYRLGEYVEAAELFEEQRTLTVDNPEAALWLRRTSMRLKEQKTGEYDFPRLRQKHRGAAESVDAAEFTARTKVRHSAGKGRGCYAKCDFAIGSLVMCEKAFCVARPKNGQVTSALTYDTRDDQIRVQSVGLVKVLVEKLVKNPGCIANVMSLDGGRMDNTNGVSSDDSNDSTPALDALRLHDIVRHNAFAITANGDKTKEASTGLWLYAAMINHSCTPNIEAEFIGDLVIFRATRSIKANEEILHCYDATRDYNVRKAALKTTWDFECDCVLCVAEAADAPDVRMRREELARKADAFVQRTSLPPTRLAIVEAKRLLNAIKATYEAERYRDLPRSAVQAIEIWLASASASASARR